MVRWDDLKADVKEVFNEFKRHKIGWIGVTLIAFMVMMGALAPVIAPQVNKEWGPANERWEANPRSSPPVWLDWITREDYHHHTVVDWDGDVNETEYSYRETAEAHYTHDILYDEPGNKTLQLRREDSEEDNGYEILESKNVTVKERTGIENITVKDFSVDPIEGDAPLDVQIYATITHTGDDQNRTISLDTPDDLKLQNENLSMDYKLQPGETVNLDRRGTFYTDGLFTIGLGVETKIIRVGAGYDVEVDGFQVSINGLEAMVTAEVTNIIDEERTVKLRVDREMEDTEERETEIEEEYTLDAGERREINYPAELPRDGKYYFTLGPVERSRTVKTEEGESTASTTSLSAGSLPDRETEVKQRRGEVKVHSFAVSDEVTVGDIETLTIDLENEYRAKQDISLYIGGEEDDEADYELERDMVIAPAGQIRGYEHTFTLDMQADKVPRDIFMDFKGEADRYRQRYIEISRPTHPWKFAKWTGDHESQEEKITIEMDEDKELQAHFGEEKFNLRSVGSVGNGTVEMDPSQQWYESGDKIDVKALPSDPDPRDNDPAFSLGEENETYLEEGTIDPGLQRAIDTMGYSVEDDAEVFKGEEDGVWFISENGMNQFLIEVGQEDLEVYTVDDPSEWEFSHWTGDHPEGDQYEEEITVEMEGTNKLLRPAFDRVDDNVQTNHTLTVNIEGDGNGTVDVDGEVVGQGWSQEYGKYTAVRLEAKPEDGNGFDGWGGDISRNAEAVTVFLDEDKEVTANFDDEIRYDLDIIERGKGKVERVDDYFQVDYEPGTEVTLKATPEDKMVLEDLHRGDRVGEFHDKVTVVRRTNIRDNIYGQAATFLRSEYGINKSELPEKHVAHPTEILFTKDNKKWMTSDADPLKGEYEVTIRLEGINVNMTEAETTFSGAVYGVMGTDNKRRDIFQGWVWGARYGLIAGGVVALTTILFGTTFGMTSAYYGGWVDELMQRLNEILMGIPTLPILIILLRFWSRSIWVFVLIYALLMWRGAAKVIRSRGLQVAQDTYIEAAESLGSGSGRIIATHMIPQILPYAIAQAALLVPIVIMSEAGLHILGLGDPTIVSWGTLLNEANESGAVYNWRRSWFWILFPGVGMALVGFGFISTGMAIERIINPKMKQR